MSSWVCKSLKVFSFFTASLMLSLPVLQAAHSQGETIELVLFEEAVQGPAFVISLPADVYADSEWEAKRDFFVEYLKAELSLILEVFTVAAVASEVEVVSLPVEFKRKHLDSEGKTADVIRIVFPLVSSASKEYQDTVYNVWHMLKSVVNNFIKELPTMDYAQIKADLEAEKSEKEDSASEEKDVSVEGDEEEADVLQGVPVEMTTTTDDTKEEDTTEDVSDELGGDETEESTQKSEGESEEGAQSGKVEENTEETEEDSASEEKDVSVEGDEEEADVLQGVPVEMTTTTDDTKEEDTTEDVSDELGGDETEESTQKSEGESEEGAQSGEVEESTEETEDSSASEEKDVSVEGDEEEADVLQGVPVEMTTTTDDTKEEDTTEDVSDELGGDETEESTQKSEEESEEGTQSGEVEETTEETGESSASEEKDVSVEGDEEEGSEVDVDL